MPPLRSHKPKQPELVRTVSYPRRMHGARMGHQTHARAHAWAHIVPFIAVFVLLVGGLWFIPSLVHQEPETTADNAQVPAEPQEAAVAKLDFSSMTQQINAAIAEHPSYETGVTVIDIKTGDILTYGAPEPFVAASTAKLLTAIAYLRDVEQGKYSLSDPVGRRDAKTALEAMIVDSDNEAWDAFNNGILGHTELTAFSEQIGLENYNADKNTITTVSVAKLLQTLYDEKLLSAENTDLLMGYMKRAKEVEYISTIVPPGVRFYHKPGYLSDRVHDATIIDNGSRPYVLVIFSKSRTKYYDGQAGMALFQQIANATFTTFLTE